MTEYPILVERYTGNQSLTIICERCGSEDVISPDEILNEDLYECPADTEIGRQASTARRCHGTASMKYAEADRCHGCRRLGFWDHLDGCCSRRCQLQAEYARSLEANR